MPTTQTEGEIELVGSRIDVAGCREDHALVGDDERPVELGEFFEGLTDVGVVYALALVGVAV